MLLNFLEVTEKDSFTYDVANAKTVYVRLSESFYVVPD
ncbi:hypothetical protein SP19_80 [Salmonella phage 19]|nr:hypothetical protein SP19_80 [Salmonella phage 19]